MPYTIQSVALYYYLVSYQVSTKGEQQADEEVSKSISEPAGSASTDNSNVVQTGQQEKSDSDAGFDQVDADMSCTNQTGNMEFSGSHSSSIEKETQSTVEENKGRRNSEVPKIEVITTSTPNNSSFDEDSGKEERKKKKLRKKPGSGEQDDEDKNELKDELDRLTRENETMKQTIENLSKEKSSLEENLQDERNKIEVSIKVILSLYSIHCITFLLA